MGQHANTTSIIVTTTKAEQLVALRAERELVWLFNSAGTLYYKFGLGASETSFTGRLTANEMSPPLYRYSGPITAIKAGSGNTTVYVTECW